MDDEVEGDEFPVEFTFLPLETPQNSLKEDGGAILNEDPLACEEVDEENATEATREPEVQSNLPIKSALSFKNKRDFNAEMDSVISGIIDESLLLFQKDPREYHPYYLRMFKYVTMGQKLGYLTSRNASSMWEKYDAMCQARKAELDRQGRRRVFTGEESPYAIFIKTGKVIVNGKEINFNRNAEEVKKIMQNLVEVSKEIVAVWENERKKPKRGRQKACGNILNDLKTRLEFFEHCKSVTFPADCAAMNKIWNQFVNHFVNSSMNTTEHAAVSPSVNPAEPSLEKSSRSKRHSRRLEGLPEKVEPEPEAESKIASSHVHPIKQEPDSDLENQMDDDDTSFMHVDESLQIKKRKVDTSESAALVNSKRAKVSKASKKPKENGSRKVIDTSNLEKPKVENKTGAEIQPTTSTKPEKKSIRTVKSVKRVLKPEQMKACRKNVKKSKSFKKLAILMKHRHPKENKVQVNLERMICKKGSLPKKKFLSQTKKMPFTNEEDSVSSKKPPVASPPASPSVSVADEPVEEAQESGNENDTKMSKKEPTPSMCEECGKVFPSAVEVKRHKWNAHTNYKSQCPFCPMTYRKGRDLFVHFLREHTVQGRALLNKKVVGQGKVSLAVDAREKSTSTCCDMCGEIFENNLFLRKHIATVHNPERNICPHCDKSFSTKDSMTAHIKQIHLGESYPCDVCGRNMQSAGKLWKHKLDNHSIPMSELPPPPGISLFECELCGERMLRGMKKHMEKSHPGQQGTCKEIIRGEDRVLNRDSALPSVKIKKLKESKSAREFKKLQRHMCRETGEGPAWLRKEMMGRSSYIKDSVSDNQSCQICGKVLKTGYRALREHLQKEHQTGDWVCNLEGCNNLRFIKKELLENHLKNTHFDIVKVLEEAEAMKKKDHSCTPEDLHNEFICMVCSEVFWERDVLAVHFMVKHQNVFEKLEASKKVTLDIDQIEMECPYCKEAMENEKHLQRHIEMIHYDFLFNCPECEKLLTGPEDLQEHFFLEHKWLQAIAEEEKGKARQKKARIGGGFGPKSKKLINMPYVLTCPKCPKMFRNMKEMTMHMESLHPESVFKCSCTNPPRFTERSYYFHLVENSNHSETRADLDPEIYKTLFTSLHLSCDLCGHDITVMCYTDHLKRYHGVVEDGDLFTCPCKKIPYRNRGYWMTHMEEFHGKKAEELLEFAKKVNASKNVLEEAKNLGVPPPTKTVRTTKIKAKKGPKERVQRNSRRKMKRKYKVGRKKRQKESSTESSSESEADDE